MLKCPSRRANAAPPAQCTMNASRMMARMTTTSQKKNTTMPGIAYPATSLVLATGPGYPAVPDLFRTVGYGWLAGPAVGPAHPGGPAAGAVNEATAYAEARLAVGPISRASTSPANAVPCPIDANNQSLSPSQAGPVTATHARPHENHRTTHSFGVKRFRAARRLYGVSESSGFTSALGERW